MNKKKIIKIVSAILGVVVFIFICNQVDEILDNRRVRLEVEKDRAERQEKKEADQIARRLYASSCIRITVTIAFFLVT